MTAPSEYQPAYHDPITSVRKKQDRWRKVLDGDASALWAYMFDLGMCSKEDLYEYPENER